MGERLNAQDLIELLIKRQGLERKNAESFIKEFFALIEEALKKDRYVKIKGLGTFKLIDVENRESINVNTGERIEIQGYAKISFIPEISLREIINKPFAHFETVLLNENVTFNDESQEESIEEESDERNKIEEENTQEEEECPEKKNDIEIEKEGVSESEVRKAEQAKNEKLTLEKRVSKMSYSVLITIILIITLVCNGILIFTYYSDIFSSSQQHLQQNVTSIPENQNYSDTFLQNDTLESNAPITALSQTDSTEYEVGNKPETEKHTIQSSEKTEKTKTSTSKVPVIPDSTGYVITGTKTTYTIQAGETLTKVALRFYGTKDVWPYLVIHNRTIIKNPDKVPYGTVIKIPELKKNR